MDSSGKWGLVGIEFNGPDGTVLRGVGWSVEGHPIDDYNGTYVLSIAPEKGEQEWPKATLN
jgi:hypothetical protein